MSYSYVINRGTLIILTALLFLALTAGIAQAATYTVTKTADTADGSCSAADCSLREAVIAANANAETDTIALGSETYKLTKVGRGENAAATGDLDLTAADKVTVQGVDGGSTVIDADGIDRAFDILAGSDLVLNDLTIQNGLANVNASGFGGAINNDAALSISDCTFQNNTAATNSGAGGVSGFGGAIYNTLNGSISMIEDSTFSGNIALDQSGSGGGSGSGGAIYNSGTINTIDPTTFNNNKATENTGTGENDGYGGAIFNNKTITLIDQVTFTNNIANTTIGGGYGFGGAIYHDAGETIATIQNSTFNSNTAELNNGGLDRSGFGGAIYSDGFITTLKTSTFSSNTAKTGTGTGDGYGGALYNIGTLTTMDDVTVDSNVALNDDDETATSDIAFGGGIYNAFDILTIKNSTISNNIAKTGSSTVGSASGGGMYDDSSSEAIFQNTTFSGNTALYNTGTGSPSGYGGGIYDSSTDMTYDHLTITNNTSAVNAGSGSSVGFGGGLDNNGTIILKNSIIAGNDDDSASNNSPDCDYTGTLTSVGYNIIGDTTGCSFPAGTGDQTNTDPLLNSLADNGGPTKTHSFQNNIATAAFAVQAISPALDKIPVGSCTVLEDQRGMVRPENGLCDVGAYELDQTDPAITLTDGNIDWLIGDDWVDPGYSATDNFDGDITSSVTITGKVKPNYLGTKVLEYSVSDSTGNTATATRAVEVITRGKVIKLTPLKNNRVKVKYEDGSSQKFTIWIKGSAKPKVKLSTNGKRIVGVKKTGKKLKVLRALTGQVKAKRKTFLKKKQAKVKLKVFNLYKKNKKNEIVVTSRRNKKLKTTVIGLTKKNKLKNKNSQLHAPFNGKFFKIKKKKKNILIKRKDNSIIVQYNVTKLGDLLPL